MDMKRKLVFLGVMGVLATSLALLSGCHGGERSHGDAHWSYSGHTGPTHWGELSPDFVLCKSGKQQSPIDISDARPSQGSLQFRYKPTILNLVNNGHAIQQDCGGDSLLEVGDQRYSLKQFHIHSGSEHTVEGNRYDMEIHLVHASPSGELAVVGVLLQEGRENAFLKRFWNQIPREPGKRVRNEGLRINVQDILPRDLSCYAYEGSLTTPPCTEGVKWYVLSQPVDLSASQLKQFRDLYNGTYRPVQPLNGRTVVHFAQ